MLEAGKSVIFTSAGTGGSELSMGALRKLVAGHASKALVFQYEGRSIRSGYHITEVKSGSFVALDCGANPESWHELFVQLLDVSGDGPHMAASKFAAIIGKVGVHFAVDDAAKLTFEVSDGIAPMRLFMARVSDVTDTEIHLQLVPRPASCKPRDRWLAQERASAVSTCCAPAQSGIKQACCS